MPATVRYDEQYCPIARALDLLGDRWTLLVLRELVTGERRFTDLKASLPGVTPAVLTARLRTLEAQGLITPVPGAGARPRYTATDRGREAVPVLRALARFGMPLLQDPAEVPPPRPWSAVQTCVVAWYDPVAAAGIDERYRLVVDGEAYPLSSVRGGGPPRDPDLIVTCPAATLFAVRQGRTTFERAVADGHITVEGPAAALAHFRTVFGL